MNKKELRMAAEEYKCDSKCDPNPVSMHPEAKHYLTCRIWLATLGR